MPKRHIETRARAKALRQTMTPPERALWDIVRARRLAGVKFVRQAVRPPYIADFAARSHRLIVELDGDTHGSGAAQAYDARRTALRRRYSVLVRRYHPDRNGGDRSHEARLQRVVEAYQLLRGAAAFA